MRAVGRLGAILLALAWLSSPYLSSEEGVAKGTPPRAPGSIAHRTLANGLEVFVVPDHSVPLATVCIVFRGGAIAQDEKNAGLFHLYEHMMFDGNEKYPSQAAFRAGLNRLGASDWNGATSDEFINYFISIPSERLGEGIEFWSWAIEKPVFNEAKLEVEKKVVLDEIRGVHADPNAIMENAVTKRVFPFAPWRKNIDGPESNVQGATVAQLEAIRDSWYIPQNAALMIGGDVESEAVFALAQRWFGEWKGRGAPTLVTAGQEPAASRVEIVYPDDSFYKGLAQVQFRWRAPDVIKQASDTYIADVLFNLIASPIGRFKIDLMKKDPDLLNPEYISFHYPTSRDGSTFYFSAVLKLGDPATDAPLGERAERLRLALDEELALVARDPVAFFPAGALRSAKNKLVDRNAIMLEDTGRFITDVLSFWWAVAGTDYFLGYESNCLKVKEDQLVRFLKRYLADRPEAVAIRVDSAWLAANETAKPGQGAYEKVGADNAFWWQK